MTDEKKRTVNTVLHGPHQVFHQEFATAMVALKEEQPMLDFVKLGIIRNEIQTESRARQMTLDVSVEGESEAKEAFKKLQALARKGKDEDD